MLINVEYKIINPILKYSKPDKMILITTIEERKRHYLKIRNPLKDKFKRASFYFLIKKSSNKKKEIIKWDYKEPEIFFIMNSNNQIKKLDLEVFKSDLLGKFTIIDYFYTRNIKYLEYELSITNIKNTSNCCIPFKIEVIREYIPNQKYSLFILKYNDTDIKCIKTKECIFNIKNILGNEELYLDLKDNHDLVEIEEDTDLICIIDNKEYYK